MIEKRHTAIIIDDMKLARATLRLEISDTLPGIQIIGEADGVVQGIKLAKDTKPDIVFLDIEMQDGDGFDLLDILTDLNSKVIFVTASNEYAIKAFQYAAVDYIMKPVDPDLLRKAVEKVIKQGKTQKEQILLVKEQMKGYNKPSTKLALHTSDKIQIVDFSEIIRLEAMGNYTTFYLQDVSKVLVTRTLKEYDRLLSPSGFLRVHQSHLINLEHVAAYVKSDGGYISMKDNSHVPVSVRKKPKVTEILSSL